MFKFGDYIRMDLLWYKYILFTVHIKGVKKNSYQMKHLACFIVNKEQSRDGVCYSCVIKLKSNLAQLYEQCFEPRK